MKQRLCVVGAGAVGLGLAVAARENGIGVSLLGRHGPVMKGRLHVGNRMLEASFEIPDDDVALIVVTTKSYDVDVALRAILAYADLPLLVLRNGLSSMSLATRLATEGIVWGCCSRDAGHGVQWAGAVRIVVDSAWGGVDVARRLLSNGWVEVAADDDIRLARYRKLMVNVGVNTLTALLRLDCAALEKDPDAMNIAVAVAKEIAMLAAASGVDVGVDPAGYLRDAVKGMGAFMPSMAQDIVARRPPETRALLEEPLRLGHELGLDMPALRALCARALDAWNYRRDHHT